MTGAGQPIVAGCHDSARRDRAGAVARPPLAIRIVVILVGAAMAAPCVAVSLAALHVPAVPTCVATTLLIVIGMVVANAKAPRQLAALTGGGRPLFVLWLVLAGGAVYRISSLAMFIDDPSRTAYAYRRTMRELDDAELTKPFYPTHNCSTCYIVAAHLVHEATENLYDRKYYRDAEVKTPIHETIGETFHVDQYQYPPPFLLGPYAALATGLDFFQLRSHWFSFSVLLFVLISGAVTVWVCGWRFCALWLIWPAVLIAPPSIATLQIGNAHLFMVLVALLSMLLFEKEWNLSGGILLAYATLSKFFPGLLIVYLLFRRQWKAFGWTVAAGVGLSAATFLAFGADPYKAFLSDQLPAIASGRAFWFAFQVPGAMLANASITGLLYKLKGMGIVTDWQPQLGATILTWAYTIVAIAVAAVVGRRHASMTDARSPGSYGQEARLWIARGWVALIILGQVRSPFLPAGYGHVPVLLLLMLLLPVERTGFARLILVGVGMCLFAVPLPLPVGPSSSALDFAFSFLTGAMAIALAAGVAMARPPPAARARSRDDTEVPVV